MKIINEDEVLGDIYTGEYARSIKHLCAPWNFDTKYIWLGIIKYSPNASSNKHSHDEQEEVFYCISGNGYIVVDQEKRILKSGPAVYVPPKSLHQIINDTNNELIVLSAVSPLFEI